MLLFHLKKRRQKSAGYYKNGAGQVFLNFLGKNIRKSVLNLFMNAILTVLIT